MYIKVNNKTWETSPTVNAQYVETSREVALQISAICIECSQFPVASVYLPYIHYYLLKLGPSPLPQLPVHNILQYMYIMMPVVPNVCRISLGHKVLDNFNPNPHRCDHVWIRFKKLNFSKVTMHEKMYQKQLIFKNCVQFYFYFRSFFW